MAPIDFEKELQKRWRSREIKPREEIWTRLSARLEREGPALRRGPELWMFMAAASVVLLIGFFLFRQPAENVPSLPPIVRTPEAELPIRVTPAPEKEGLSESREAEAGSLAESHSERMQEKPSGKDEKRVATPGAPQAAEQAAARLLAGSHEKGFPEEAHHTSDLAAPAEIADAETGPEGALETEIDALLEHARESIGLQNRQESLSPVDARGLLDRAEDELDQTFREKIMEKLKSGVTRSRTSVVNRDK